MIQEQRLYTLARRLLLALITLYTGGLACYLILRLLFTDTFWWLALANAFARLMFVPLILAIPLTLLIAKNRLRLCLLITQSILCSIALLWFILPILPPNVPPADGPTLKVITFNVLGDGRPLDDVVDWLRSQDADVIVLQEITAEDVDPRLKPLMTDYPHEIYLKGNVRIFSRFPFVESNAVWTERVPGHLVQRGVIEVAGQRIVIYGVHFILPETTAVHFRPMLPFPLRLLNTYDETRRNKLITRMIELVEAEIDPTIVLGDFNTSDTSIMYNRLAASLTDSYREASGGLGLSWPVASAFHFPSFLPPLLRIDYVWHTGSLRAVEAWVGPELGSDHLPLVVTLAVE